MFHSKWLQLLLKDMCWELSFDSCQSSLRKQQLARGSQIKETYLLQSYQVLRINLETYGERHF